MKGLDQWRIDDIKANKGKKTALQLAAIHNCHYRTVENYWKEIEKPIDGQIEICRPDCTDIKVWFVNGKSLNFDQVTNIEKDMSKGIYNIWGLEEVIAILEAPNVSAIIPR